MVSIAALVAFLGLIAAGAVHSLPIGSSRNRPRRATASIVIGWVVAASLTAGASQRDLWPFSAWRLVVDPPPVAVGSPPDAQSIRIRAFDQDGVDHAVDYRAWQPLPIEDLTTWLVVGFPELSEQEKQEAAVYLLARANEGRDRAARGDRFGVSDRFLGRLSAPFHLLHPRRWSDPADVPSQRFVGLRFYREAYDLEEVVAGEPIRLELVYEFRSEAP